MGPVSCDEIRSALLWALTSSRLPPHTSALSRHLARCPECQALRSHVLGLLLPGMDEPAVGCEACQNDLAAYVDMTLDTGAREAAAALPHAWWHLWECVGCATILAQTATLAIDDRQSTLPSLPAPQTTTTGRQVIGRLSIAPPLVARLLQTHKLLGRAYGDQGEIVLVEDESGGHSFQLSVQPEPGGTWAIIVAVIPPITGQAVIEIGDALFHIPFNAQGVAQVTGLPAAHLRDGPPGISVAIEAA